MLRAPTRTSRTQGSPAGPGVLAVAVAVALAAVFITFVLPFLFGSHQQPVYSATYPVGAENRVATVGLAALSLLVLLWAAWRTQSTADKPAARLGSRAAILGAALIALWTLTLGAAVVHAQFRYGESAYFLERMGDMFASPGRIYTDVEFPYGPLLLLPPVWLAHLGVPLPVGYFASLILLNVAGVLMTAYVLNRLPLGRSTRVVLFWLFCFEQANPLAGANYSLGKFMLPFAVLLWGVARRSEPARAISLALGQFLAVMVSPELGLGLAAAVCGWAVLTAWQTRRAGPLLVALAPPLGVLAFFGLYGRGFLDRLGHASAGALNLVIEPLPHIFVLVAAVVLLAPLAVGRRLRVAGEGAMLAGVFLLALGLLPGALGRSDPLHIFFNGFGFLLLACIGLERFGRRWAWLWMGAIALVCLQVQITNFAIYRPALEALVAAAGHPVPPDALDTNLLREQTKGAPIATPALMQLSLGDEMALRQAGLFVADKNPGLAEIWTPADEWAKVLRLRQSSWALLPAAGFLEAEGSPDASAIKRFLRLGYRYPQRHPPYMVGLLLEQELAANWQPMGRFGDAILYQRVR